jgi:hypothetical protein
MIVGLTVVRDEKEQIETTIRHLLAHGIDRILVIDHRSMDGTSEILARLARETGRIEIERKEDRYYRQELWTNEMLARAAALNPTWILPFDADEIFVPLTRPTLADELRGVRQGVFRAAIWTHASLERRAIKPLPLTKVIFSWQPGCAIDVGAHEVWHHPGPEIFKRIEVRERGYLSWEHFEAKTKKHLEARRPECPPDRSVQFWSRRNMDCGQLTMEYLRWWRQANVVYDPIPLKPGPAIRAPGPGRVRR